MNTCPVEISLHDHLYSEAAKEARHDYLQDEAESLLSDPAWLENTLLDAVTRTDRSTTPPTSKAKAHQNLCRMLAEWRKDGESHNAGHILDELFDVLAAQAWADAMEDAA